MIPAFDTRYRPLTSRPFLRDDSYTEYAPCPALRPYIACFWAMEGSGKGGAVRVIPDTCMDIIIEINHSRQTVKTRLCGLQDYSVFSQDTRLVLIYFFITVWRGNGLHGWNGSCWKS